MTNNSIKSYRDLKVYKSLYKIMVEILTKVLPKLPKEEKYDLANQMRRACKAPPALIAEGFAKRHHKKQWQKYLDDCLGECNEMINYLSLCIDVYPQHVDINLCKELINLYNITSAQIYSLRKSWQNFHQNN